MRVVWLCTFSNPEKRSYLSLWRDRGREVGQWIPNLIEGFKDDTDIELHVVTLEPWMKGLYRRWMVGRVTYHCFSPPFPGLGYNLRFPIEEWTDFRWNRHRVCRLIRKLDPDVVNLFGFENPRYATAVLDLPPTLPVVCFVQGFVTRELRYHNTYVNRVRAKFERRIVRHLKNYIGDYDSEKLIREWNPQVNYEHAYFPVNDALVAETGEQPIRYDVLFAGGQSKAKGFGDFLEVVAACAKAQPGFSAAVVGDIDAYPETRTFIEREGLGDVITWTGRFPTQKGLFAAYRQSRLFLAPTYNDAFPSTIRENMLLGVPCIAYETGGIPYANDDGHENVAIVPQGDCRAMAERVLHLISHESERQLLAVRAKRYAKLTFSREATVKVMKCFYERLKNEL